jgi:hypothetical protein
MTKEITPQQRLTVLKHLANGRTLELTATATRLTRDQVLDIGNHHGYPHTDKLAWAVDVLTKKIEDDEAAAAISTSDESPSGVKLVDRPARPAAVPTRPEPARSPQPPQPAAPQTTSDQIGVLLNTAKQMSPKRIQSLADRILADVARLRDLVTTEQVNTAAREREDREKAAARAEVERLEKQLAAAKAKLRPSPPPAPAAAPRTSASAKEIRSWATDNGVECPTRGVLPARVVAAYAEAHQEAGDAA